jgi:copper chaperone CopZ
MTLPKLLMVASISGVLFISCKQTASAPTEKQVAETKSPINKEKLEKATFTIEGMTCAIGCAKTIEKELSETNGVQSASVDFDKKQAVVSFDSSIQSTASITKIVEATADGETYKVSNMVASK